MIRDELSEILVGRDHEGFDPGLFGLMSKGADDVVSLVAIHDQDGNIHGLEQPFHLRNGLCDVFGHFLALSLVLGIHFVARCGRRGIESDGKMGRFLLGGDVEEGVGEAVKRRGVDAVSRENGGPDEGKMGPVDERHAIEKKESFRHAAQHKEPCGKARGKPAMQLAMRAQKCPGLNGSRALMKFRPEIRLSF